LAKKRSRANSPGTSVTTCDQVPRAEVDQVVKWALQGVTQNDLREAVEQPFPGKRPELLLAAATKEFEAAGKADRTAIRGFCFYASRDLYRRALEIGDFATALRAIKQLDDLSRR